MATYSTLDRLLSHYARMPDHPTKLRLFGAILRLFGKDRIVARNEFGEMELDTNDLVQREILFRGGYEPKSLELVRGLLRNGDTFLDIGSHVGEFSLAAAKRVGATGRVIAFEPNPPICAALLRNRERSRPAARFDVVCAALADGDRVVSFATHSKDNAGSARIVSTVEGDGLFCVTTSYRKVAETLGIGAVRLAKIDVEGSELLVLREMLALERSSWPEHIVFEFIPEAFDYSDSPAALLTLLREHDYTLHTVDGEPYTDQAELPENNIWARRTMSVS